MLGGGILASGAAVVNDLLSDQLFQLVEEDVFRLIDIFDAGYELPSRENSLSSGEYPPLYVYPGGELNPCRTSVTLNCSKGPFGCLPSAPTSLAARLSASFLNCIHQVNSSNASASKVCTLLE